MPKKAPGRSDREGLSVIELFQMFPDEATSRTWFEDIRWPDGERHCPHCGSLRTSPVSGEKPMPYHCAECREYFSVKTGTVMQSSKVPLQKWVITIYLLSTSLDGVSSMKLHRDLKVTQKTAWALAQKIREGWINGSEKVGGSVEVDDGKECNKHRSKKFHASRDTVGKSAVTANVEAGAAVFTEEDSGYNGESASFEHQAAGHGAGAYVNSMAHANGIENFSAMLKRGYKGTIT